MKDDGNDILAIVSEKTFRPPLAVILFHTLTDSSTTQKICPACRLALRSSWQLDAPNLSNSYEQKSWRTPKSRTWAWPSLAARSWLLLSMKCQVSWQPGRITDLDSLSRAWTSTAPSTWPSRPVSSLRLWLPWVPRCVGAHATSSALRIMLLLPLPRPTLPLSLHGRVRPCKSTGGALSRWWQCQVRMDAISLWMTEMMPPCWFTRARSWRRSCQGRQPARSSQHHQRRVQVCLAGVEGLHPGGQDQVHTNGCQVQGC